AGLLLGSSVSQNISSRLLNQILGSLLVYGKLRPQRGIREYWIPLPLVLFLFLSEQREKWIVRWLRGFLVRPFRHHQIRDSALFVLPLASHLKAQKVVKEIKRFCLRESPGSEVATRD